MTTKLQHSVLRRLRAYGVSVLGIGILLAAAAQAPAAAATLPATVPVSAASSTWVDTGIALTAGVPVDITAMGQASCHVAGDGNTCPVNPDGVNYETGAVSLPGGSDFLAPGLPSWGLVAKVGSGPALFVGSGPTTVGGSGELYLAFNDNDYTDNEGSFTATIAPLGAVDLASCQAIHSAYPTAADGEYAVRVNGMEVPVYCSDMASGSPGEYLSLPVTGGGHNSSSTPADDGSATATTAYTKLALDPVSMKASVSDTTYATTTFDPSSATSIAWAGGHQTYVPYATAEDCQAANSAQGKAYVNLTGTPFGVVNNFGLQGNLPGGTTTVLDNGQAILLTGGGFCGANGPGPNIQGINYGPPVGFALGLTWLGPTITAQVSPAPNGAGWNTAAVTVNFACTAGSVSGISFCPQPVTVSGDGANQTVTGMAVDSSGNQAYATVAVNIDTQSPTVTQTGAVCSQPGSNGWCQGTETVTFTAAEAVSGVASPCTGTSCTFPVSTATNGSAVTAASGQVCSVAGSCNPGITSTSFMIDSVPPTVALSFTPNGSNGWFDTATASGTVTASDGTSGLASLTCTDNGNPLTVGDAGALSVTGDGVHSLACTATDKAGNTATATTTVKIDSAAPEASLQVAPPPAGSAPNLTVTASNALAADTATVAGPSCTPAPDQHGWYGHDDLKGPTPFDGSSDPDWKSPPMPPFDGRHAAQLCTWTVTNGAGNGLAMTVWVADDGHQVHAAVVSLVYTTGAGSKTVKPADNSVDAVWFVDPHTGTLQFLHQQMQVGRGASGQHLLALYDAHRNATMIIAGHGKPVTQTGLTLLVVSTSGGQLSLSS